MLHRGATQDPSAIGERSVADLMDAFYPIWSFPPPRCPFDGKAYLDFALAVAGLHTSHDGKTRQSIPSSDIYDSVDDATLNVIDSFDRRLQGLRRSGNLPSCPNRLTIDHVRFKGFVFTVGELLHNAWTAENEFSCSRSTLIKVVDAFFTSGDIALFKSIKSNNAPRAEEGPEGGQPTPAAAARAVGCMSDFGDKRQNRRLERSDRYSVKGFHDRFVRESGFSVDKAGSLSALKPLSPWLDIPKSTAQVTLDRYPALKDNPGHRALFQNIMMGRCNAKGSGQGVFIKWELIAQHYGLKPWRLRQDCSFNTGDLLQWFCEDMGVERDNVVLEAIHWKGLARTITRDWIDGDVYRAWKEAMYDPYTKREWINWINGKKSGTRTASKARERERRDQIMTQEPTITPPRQLKAMRDYMNSRSSKLYTRKGTGAFCEANMQAAIDAARELKHEQAQDDQLRHLYTMRAHPQPLYLYCDRFPRLKADHWNQAINVSSGIRPAFYGDRDVELDLAKAHLAGFVPVAASYGYDMPVLGDHLERSLTGEIDLWADIASYMDTDVLPDAAARRKAAKSSYALVYGSSLGNFYYEVLKSYAAASGAEMTTQNAVERLTEHPVIREVLEVRATIQAHINADGGIEDATGRWISLSKWDDVKDEDDRWRGALAYVNCSYEHAVLYTVFEQAIKEEASDERARFQIWLLQGDGLTIRLSRKRHRKSVVRELQQAVKARADELGMPTQLEVAATG